MATALFPPRLYYSNPLLSGDFVPKYCVCGYILTINIMEIVIEYGLPYPAEKIAVKEMSVYSTLDHDWLYPVSMWL